MKKTIILFFAIMFVFSAFVSADTFPANSHLVSKCVTIDNLDEFPEIAVVKRITGPGGSTTVNGGLEIIDNTCLSKGYKFNNLNLLWVEKTYVDTLNLENYDPYTKVLKKDIEYDEEHKCYRDMSQETFSCRDSMEEWYEDEPLDTNFHAFDVDIEPWGGYVSNSNPMTEIEEHYNIIKTNDGYDLELYGTNKEKDNKYNIFYSAVCFFKNLFGGRC